MNVLITGAWDNASNYISEIEALGLHCKFMQYENEELPCSFDWPDIILCGNLFDYYDAQKFTNLKFVQSYSAGVEKFPIKYFDDNEIKLNNALDVYSIPIAESVVLGILQCCKNSKFNIKNQLNHLWEKDRNRTELSNKSACIVGCGNIGTAVARRLRPFCKNIYGICREEKEINGFDKTFSVTNISKALQVSEIVVVCLPLNRSTLNLFDECLLSKIKDNSIFVNISRGKIVDEKALVSHASRFTGIVLDVFYDEPLDSNSPLWDIENAYITPHNSFVSDGNDDRMWSVIKKFLLEV